MRERDNYFIRKMLRAVYSKLQDKISRVVSIHRYL